MKVREVIERLESDGWYLARTKGSHRQFKHPTKLGTVTVPGKLSCIFSHWNTYEYLETSTIGG